MEPRLPPPARVIALHPDELLLAALQDADVAVFTKDRQGRYTSYNPEALRALAARRRGLLGRTDAELLPPEDAQATAALEARAMAERRVLCREVERETGVFLESHGPLLDAEGAVAGTWGVLRDIGPLRRERELERALIGIVGHDLHTPLLSLALSLDLVKKEPLSPVVEKQVLRMDRAHQQMRELVYGLLDVARLRNGQALLLRLTQLELGEVCGAVGEQLQALYPGQRIELSVSGSTRGSWDSGRLLQVVTNLVDNALQHAPDGEPVRVQCEGRDDDVLLVVQNRGEPIPETLLPHVFEPFRSGGHPSRAVKAPHGLGLYIVREMVRAHGGEVSVSSTREEGTAFRVRLPREPGKTPRAA